jgi:predicted amidophosphoribosyltransferase
MQRGFNQSTFIANALGATLHVPVRDLLRRIRHRGPQSDLPLENRRTHVQGVFKAKKSNLSGTLCLVDDVATSTSTLREAANILRKAGATCIVAITATRCADGRDAQLQM